VSRRAALLFLTLGVAWGIPYLLIKVAVDEISPAQLVLGRCGLATLILLPIAISRGAIRPLLPRWRWLLVFVVVEIAVPWVLLGSAETHLPSSTTGLLIAAVPLAGLAIAFLTGHGERLTRSGWAGIGLGVLGVAALVGLDIGGSDLRSVAEVGVVVIGYAAGPAILSRPLNGLPGIGIMASALTITTVVYVPVVLVSDGVPGALPSAKVVWSVVALGAVCTAAAFMLLFALVGEVGPVRTTTVTYVNPAVALIAGAVVLGEPVTGRAVAGFALILAGCVLVAARGKITLRLRKRPAAEPIAEPIAEAAPGLAPVTSDAVP
jgi:drug/metabolite transporter (DMT)-like permease